ncbi:hypothetical protein J1614_007828 [Plenodomus biglobosus]|nr:hypothetical protein J1614_007828 [Plenodomus biglobosus]
MSRVTSVIERSSPILEPHQPSHYILESNQAFSYLLDLLPEHYLPAKVSASSQPRSPDLPSPDIALSTSPPLAKLNSLPKRSRSPISPKIDENTLIVYNDFVFVACARQSAPDSCGARQEWEGAIAGLHRPRTTTELPTTFGVCFCGCCAGIGTLLGLL